MIKIVMLTKMPMMNDEIKFNNKSMKIAKIVLKYKNYK